MDRKAFIKSCRRNGYKYTEIAKFLGVSRQRVEQILRPLRHKAREAVQKAGLKSKTCEYPECINNKTEDHHFDYNQPLKVTWLCVKHHREFHRKHEKKEKVIRKCISCGVQVKFKNSRCKKCGIKRANKLRRIRFKNNIDFRARVVEINKEWRKKNPEAWKKIIKRANKKYRLTHPQKSVYRKEYYLKNREKYLEMFRKYYINNLEKEKLRKIA